MEIAVCMRCRTSYEAARGCPCRRLGDLARANVKAFRELPPPHPKQNLLDWITNNRHAIEKNVEEASKKGLEQTLANMPTFSLTKEDEEFLVREIELRFYHTLSVKPVGYENQLIISWK